MQKIHFRILPWILVLLVILLQYRLWFEAGGIIDMLRAKKQLALQIQENEILHQRNERLIHQVQNLQTSRDAIETRARGELGMIKKGETFYQVVK